MENCQEGSTSTAIKKTFASHIMCKSNRRHYFWASLVICLSKQNKMIQWLWNLGLQLSKCKENTWPDVIKKDREKSEVSIIPDGLCVFNFSNSDMIHQTLKLPCVNFSLAIFSWFTLHWQPIYMYWIIESSKLESTCKII